MKMGIMCMGLLALGMAGCASESDGPPPRDQAVSYRDPNDPNQLVQGTTQADEDVTDDIRRKITDRHMSNDAENIKIATLRGEVTLVGQVDSRLERDEIGAIAGEEVGDKNVDNQLLVKAD
jgi:osmotically-inducible protein OsmY